MRTVRSYVVRAGRMTAGQERAVARYWPLYGVDYLPEPLNLERLFGRAAPRTLEIGFGNGEHLLERARAEPERDFLGVEVHRPGIGHVLLTAANETLGNVRVICRDAMDVLGLQLQPASLDEVQLLFPDPWQKKRHHKRRLVQTAFAELVASRLHPGGRLHLVTDWEPYAEWMREVLAASPLLRPDHSPTPEQRVATRFERRGLRLGHRTQELWYRRLDAEAAAQAVDHELHGERAEQHAR